MAVATGVADVVVCYRAFNERSGHRFGQVSRPAAGAPTTDGVDYALVLPDRAAHAGRDGWRCSPGATCTTYGATSEDFGRVAVADRRHAATNPNAWFYGKPITLEDHQASRWIVEPLHLLDCCQESDGGVGARRDLAPSGPATCRSRRP